MTQTRVFIVNRDRQKGTRVFMVNRDRQKGIQRDFYIS